jgi:hypothetical protein
MRPRSLFVSALSAAAVASMFYVLERRHSDWPVALCATLIMSPLFWLQSGLALTDMFGMVFVVGFLLVEGWALSLIGSLGQAFGPMHLTTSHIERRAALGLLIIVPYVVLAWRGASKSIARPYLIASAVYLLFIMLPVRHALSLAAQPRRRLVGVRLLGSVPEARGSRFCARGACCGHSVAVVLPGRGA